MRGMGTAFVAIVTALLGVTILSVLLSKNSNTTGVISSLSQGFSTVVGAAVAPVGTSQTGGFGAFNSSGQLA